MAGEGNGQQSSGLGRYSGLLKTGEIARDALPEAAAVSQTGQQFKVKLGRQQEEKTHRIQRDDKPLDPIP